MAIYSIREPNSAVLLTINPYKMCKKLACIWLFSCAMAVCFQACKKSDQGLNPTAEKESNENGLLEEVKSWYFSQSLYVKSYMRTKLPHRDFGPPYWNLAKGVSKDSNSFLVPMSDYTLRNIGYCRYFFRKDKNQAIQGIAIEVLYKPSYWRRKVKEAEDNNGLIRAMKFDFTGVILEYDLSGNFIKGRSYKDGKILTAIVPAEFARAKTFRTTNDPEEDGDSNIDEGDTPDDGSGWVIDLPGVDIGPEPSDPPSGWTPSDPWTPENPYPPGGGPEDYVPGTGETGGSSGSNTTTSVITTSSTFYDEAEASGLPAPIDCGATDEKVDGLIIGVFGYWAQPRYPIVDYVSNGKTVTRRTQVMDLHGSAYPLPSAVVTVRWDYIVNYTYSYLPYSPPVTRQKASFSTKVIYAN